MLIGSLCADVLVEILDALWRLTLPEFPAYAKGLYDFLDEQIEKCDVPRLNRITLRLNIIREESGKAFRNSSIVLNCRVAITLAKGVKAIMAADKLFVPDGETVVEQVDGINYYFNDDLSCPKVEFILPCRRTLTKM